MQASFRRAYKAFNWKLWVIIFITLLVPSVYNTARVYIVGTIPDSTAFSVAGNLNWINVLFEVLEESFLLPLFYVFGTFANLSKRQRNQKISGRIFWVIICYVVVIILLIILTNPLMNLLSVNKITSQTILFVRVEFVTRLLVLTTKITSVLLIAKNKWGKLIVLLIINTGINVCLDAFLVAHNAVSLKLGLIWIGINQLITNFVMTVVGWMLIKKVYDLRWSEISHPRLRGDLKGWQQHFYSGLESFIRNAFFLWFVIKTINKLPGNMNQGDFWVMNTFLWNWLLLPIFALSQLINRNEGFCDNNLSIKERMIIPGLLITGIVLIWLVFIPTYASFIKVIMNNPDYETVAHLAVISIGFYVLFAYNEVIDKTFLGNGKAQYILLQSIIVNVTVYVPYYYAIGNITLDGVAVMMGLATGVDSLLTIAIYVWWLQRIHKKCLTVKN